MKRNRAITLTELIVALAIIMLLTAILYPVFGAVKRKAKEAPAMSNLRQQHLWFSLYSEEWGPRSGYDSLAALALPSQPQLMFDLYTSTNTDIWSSPCGSHPSEPPSVINTVYWPGRFEGLISAHGPRFGESQVLVYDLNCSSPRAQIESRYSPKIGLGVLLNGTAVRMQKEGDPHQPSWWSDPTVE